MKATPRVARMRRNRRVQVAWCLLPAVALHFYVVYTIVAQPLNVNRYPPSSRSVIWPLHNDTAHRIGPAMDFFAIYHAGDIPLHELRPAARSRRLAPAVGAAVGPRTVEEGRGLSARASRRHGPSKPTVAHMALWSLASRLSSTTPAVPRADFPSTPRATMWS